ncbi:MAG: tRNA dihydrouridine synthase DusB [Clostridiales bacterium]|nr:tRNA dihydrouridine synthase DusB [Clostridiales bacterium]
MLRDSPVLLAPMAGVTDKTFRRLAKELGAGLACTEMVSAKALSYGNAKTRALLDVEGETGPTAAQFFGSEPDRMAEAAVAAEELGAAYVDVNMGCPVPKVVKNNEGSALLEQTELAGRIVGAMAGAAGIPVAVKIRLGADPRRIVAPEFAKRMEAAGASLIAVHARTRDQFYSGKADWGQIRLVKAAVSVPVVGNGDIWTPEDARRMLEETGCDAVMVGRAALGDPWLPGRIRRYLLGGDAGLPPDKEEKIAMAMEHSRRLAALKGEGKAIPEMRKHLAWYLKGLPRTAALKEKLFHCRSMEEVEELMKGYLAGDRFPA